MGRFPDYLDDLKLDKDIRILVILHIGKPLKTSINDNQN